MEYTMVSLPDDLLVRMDREEFVALAQRIVDEKGETWGFGARYRDNWIDIRTNYNGNKLEVSRRAQEVADDAPRSHLRVGNPTTMVSDSGDIIRHHGEHIYLVWHMKRLVDE